jgi:hypothetical protein
MMRTPDGHGRLELTKFHRAAWTGAACGGRKGSRTEIAATRMSEVRGQRLLSEPVNWSVVRPAKRHLPSRLAREFPPSGGTFPGVSRLLPTA